MDETLLAAAVELAEHHWKVFPLRGKIPAIPAAHPKTLYLRTSSCFEGMVPYPNPQSGCRGECGELGHGVYDATDDLARVADWWANSYRGANIGGRIPDPVMVVDIDPRNGGQVSWEALIRRNGPFPESMMTISGRGDGGVHRFLRRPPGRLTQARLGPGIDIKTSNGYVVMAGSLHPDTGRPYVAVDGPIVAPPEWFVELVTVPPRSVEGPMPTPRWRWDSPADAFNEVNSWTDVLDPHGWECLDVDPDQDGARWRHPTASSAWSATVRYGCLFVYSNRTPFESTEAGNPKGYTKFWAFAVLNHGGDLSAAARMVRRSMTTGMGSR